MHILPIVIIFVNSCNVCMFYFCTFNSKLDLFEVACSIIHALDLFTWMHQLKALSCFKWTSNNIFIIKLMNPIFSKVILVFYLNQALPMCILQSLQYLAAQRWACWKSKSNFSITTQIILLTFVNLVTPKAGVKQKLLFNKPASVDKILCLLFQSSSLSKCR